MPENIKTKDLVDIRTVTVNKTLPKQERIIEFVRQIYDPYNYKCKEFDITAYYPPNAPSFEDCLYGIMA